ncbi:MAG: cation:proton antiporter subunit C [Defluviitaleaceae bacterium]|nr:cation:proton antiporter subunit C [Defluviitaleaceae bacterium]
MQTASIIMFFLAFFGLITSQNIIKSVICLMLQQTAVIVFFLGLRHRHGILAPIGDNLTAEIAYIADPLPQALMITAIIIGLAVVAVDITMIIYLTNKTNSTDWDEVKQKSRELIEEVK